jgi:hypothetical protein
MLVQSNYDPHTIHGGLFGLSLYCINTRLLRSKSFYWLVFSPRFLSEYIINQCISYLILQCVDGTKASDDGDFLLRLHNDILIAPINLFLVK